MTSAKKSICARVLGLLLSLSLLFGIAFSTAIPASAADRPEKLDPTTYFLYDVADAVLLPLLRVFGYLFPSVKIPSKYDGKGFMPGMQTFLKAPATGAQWHAGYASASLLEGQDVFDGKHYIGGGLSTTEKKNPEAILDDQRVRVTAINDGSGRGTVILATIDGFGFTSHDVRIIRGMLEDFAKANNIVSINISVLHQHSVIDVLGMNGWLPGFLLINPIANLTGGLLIKPTSGKNPGFMENLHKVVAASIKEAFNNMEPGQLRYASVNVREFINSKRPPHQLDPDVHRFRFVPDDPNSKETWLCNVGIHCVGYASGGDGREVTGDWPYFMEETVNAAGANFQLIQGAQLAISMDTTPSSRPDRNGYERIQDYGHGLGDVVVGITPEQEAEVPALLNVAHKEYSFPITNPLHLLLFRLGVIDSTAVKHGPLGYRLDLWTETGYMEIGDALAVAFAPGELEAALAYGGGMNAEEAWRGYEWEFTSMQETVGTSRKLLVFGLMNDHSGYMLLPNDIYHFIMFGNEEINMAGETAGPSVLAAFQALVAEKTQ